ncbi:MAG: protein kinase domain-containing protein [Endozoicomonas sp.]|uniref:protein kinase domain-containing protein n=1 Tax=Endozoicomonas sp. TaxID=1892382 RepID=UPI003D9B5AE7
MFLSELEAMSRLSHPNIVTLHGGHSYEAYDGLHLVLRQTYAGQPVKPFYCPEDGMAAGEGKVMTRLLMTQLLGFWEAVSHMKKQRVLHRDICPDNLMLLDGRLVLIDFDQATDCRNGFPRDFSGRQFYAAPETQQLKAQDYTADVFSAAVTCLKLLEWQGYIEPNSMKRVAVEKREKVGKKVVKSLSNGIKPVLKDPVPVEIEQLCEVLVQCVDVNAMLRPTAEAMVEEMKQLIELTISDTPNVSSDDDEDSLTVGRDFETSSQKSV